MNLPWLERIGVRLGISVAVVLLLLALVANATTNIAFERAAWSVEAASAAELESLARSTLLEITEREAQLIAASLDRAAAAGRTAASFLGNQIETAGTVVPSLPLVRIPTGHWLDPSPDRVSTLHVPSTVAADPIALREAAWSEALDEVFPSLAPELGDAVGIYWLSPSGVTRYYPPIDFHTMVEPEFDPSVQSIFGLGTPDANPTRETRWTAPYLDDVGNGLLVTAVSPVYGGGVFRGVVDVDVSLDRLAVRLAQLQPLAESFALLLDGQGHLITASPDALPGIGIDEPVEFGTVLTGPEADVLLASTREGIAGVVSLGSAADGVVMAHAPLPRTGWSLAIGVPIRSLGAPAQQVAASLADEARVAQRSGVVAVLLAFVLALAVLMTATRRWVAEPIAALAEGTRRVSSGELGVELPVRGNGEFQVLGEAFNRMSRALADQRHEILANQQDLERQVAERTRELSGLLAIGSDVSAAADVPSLMRSVLVRLREAVPCARAEVWLTEGDDVRRVASVPPDTAATRGPDVLRLGPLDGPGSPLRTRTPIQTTFHADDVHYRHWFDPDVSSALIVPLQGRERILGVLTLAEPDVAESHRVDLVASVAQQLARALENARLLLQIREASALEERQHLARELHDSVSQALFGVVLGLQTAKREIAGPGRLQTSVEYAAELADAALKEMRALIFELRPEALETEGLAGLLLRQADMLRARHELTVDLDAVEPEMSLEAKAVLYRVAQEALHNIVKHARARTVEVRLGDDGRSAVLEVRDDGQGFVAGSERADAFGLRSMRERMALHGGRLELTSTPGGGTRIVAVLPVGHASVPQAAEPRA